VLDQQTFSLFFFFVVFSGDLPSTFRAADWPLLAGSWGRKMRPLFADQRRSVCVAKDDDDDDDRGGILVHRIVNTNACVVYDDALSASRQLTTARRLIMEHGPKPHRFS